MRPFVLLGLLGFLGWVSPPSSAEDKAPPKKEEPPYKRVLTGADAQRVAELAKKVYQLEDAGKYQEAQAPAREIVQIRRRMQGVNHWQTTDARLQEAFLKKVAALPPDRLGEL